MLFSDKCRRDAIMASSERGRYQQPPPSQAVAAFSAARHEAAFYQAHGESLTEWLDAQAPATAAAWPSAAASARAATRS